MERTFRSFFFCHRQADPDAICSAHGLSEILAKIGGEHSIQTRSLIVAPSGTSTLATNICHKLGIDLAENANSEEIQQADLLAVLDVGSPELLGPLLQSVKDAKSPKVLVDHHRRAELGSGALDPWGDFNLAIIEPTATSTCEIIATQFDQKYLDAKIAQSLMVGLLFDSQHLGIANESTLRAALVLVQSGAKIDEAKNILRNRADRSEVIARLKSAQRLKFSEIGGYFVAESEVSSFHAAVARMLVEIGSDVGIAYGESAGETRVSVRSNQNFFRRTGVELGTILDGLARNIGLTGGGHSTAASISGRTPASEIVQRIKERLIQELPQKE